MLFAPGFVDEAVARGAGYPSRRFAVGATLIFFGAVIATAYKVDRAYRRSARRSPVQ